MRDFSIAVMLFALFIMLAGCEGGAGDELARKVSQGSDVEVFAADGAIRGKFFECGKLLVLKDESGRMVYIPYEKIQFLRKR